MSLGSVLLTVDQPKLIFNKPLQGNNGDGLLLQREGLVCFGFTKWMSGLLMRLHLGQTYNQLLLLRVVVIASRVRPL